MTKHIADNLSLGGALLNPTIYGLLALVVGVATISSGAITATQSIMQIDTEGAAASDDLTTINGGAEGVILLLRTAANARDVVIKHGTGNIANHGAVDLTLNSRRDLWLGYYNAVEARWIGFLIDAGS